MILYEIVKVNCAVYAEATLRDEQLTIELLNHLMTHSERKHAEGIRGLFNNFAKSGQPGLTHTQFHPAQRGDAHIYRFSKGQIRIYCFFDGPNIIVATHGAMKKSDKTAQEDMQEAHAVRNRYFSAQQNGKLVVRSREKPNENQ